MSEQTYEREPVQFSVSMPADLVDEIDKVAKQRFTNRATILRQASAEFVARARKADRLLAESEAVA